MGSAILFVLSALLGLAELALVLNAVFSWLVAFDVINLRNRAVYNIAHMLDRITRPMLAPFQRVIPPLGGIDITPVIAIIIIEAVRKFLLPWLFFSFVTPYIG